MTRIKIQLKSLFSRISWQMSRFWTAEISTPQRFLTGLDILLCYYFDSHRSESDSKCFVFSGIIPRLSLIQHSLIVSSDTEWYWSHWSFWCLLITDTIKKYLCHLVHQINLWSALWKDHTFVFIISSEWLWLAMR